MAKWSNRPLDSLFPALFVDAINVKIRDGHAANRPIYVFMAVPAEGHRGILGIWTGRAARARSTGAASCTDL